MRPVLAFLLLVPFVCFGQATVYYNWKGFSLEVFEHADSKGKKIGAIVPGAGVKVITWVKGQPFPIYISYYGDTVTTRKDEYAENDKHIYTLKSNWAKILWNNREGFVPAAFLSHIPMQSFHKAKAADVYTDIPILEGLKAYFGRPLSYKKQQLEKQDKEEIHFKEQYNFKGGITYSLVAQYVEEGGAGGDVHTIFLPSFALHEAILMLLELQNTARYRPREIKSFNRLKSIYDYFSWWYQPVNYDDEGNVIKAPHIYNFQYYSEGGGSGAQFTEKNGGIEIVYSYGGC